MGFVKVYQPEYYKNFSCTGSECKNNCCHHWKINIDENTYDKYMALDENAKKEFNEKLGQAGNEKTDFFFKLDADGNCVFLDENGLCTIQLRYGYDYLSNVCKYYPRIACWIGSPEYFVELSCEVAARIILFEKKSMNFEEVDLEYDVNDPAELKISHIMKPDKYTKSTKGFDIFWKLRVASVAILQNRRYRVRFRMLLLCMFMQESADLFSSGKDLNVIDLADSYMSKLEQNQFDPLSASLQNGADREYDIVLDVLKEMYGKSFVTRQTVDNVKNAFDIKPESWAAPEGIDEKFTKYYEMFLLKNEHIFENYLVHRVLSEGFPFNYKSEHDVFSNYVDLFAKFNILEFIVTGICRYNMKFDKKSIIDSVTAFTRGYEHSDRKFFQL